MLITILNEHQQKKESRRKSIATVKLEEIEEVSL